MFIIKNRLRFAPGIVFNQPVGEGGGTGEPQGGDPKAGEPQGGDPNKSGEPQGGDPKAGDYKAPWDKSGEPFDEARARRLLEAKHADEEKMRERLTELEAEKQATEDAKLTDQQRLEKERDDFKSGMSEAQLDAARLRAAIKFGLAEDDLEFINGKTPEEVLAAAERYAERHKGDDKGDPKGPPSRRPLAGRGGGNPASEPEEMDPRKLAESIQNNHY